MSPRRAAERVLEALDRLADRSRPGAQVEDFETELRRALAREAAALGVAEDALLQEVVAVAAAYGWELQPDPRRIAERWREYHALQRWTEELHDALEDVD